MTEEKKSPSKHVDSEHALKNIPKTLLIGYGNPDREDDGVAWHILRGVADFFSLVIPDTLDEDLIKVDEKLHFLFDLQLIPEMTFDMSQYSRLCFVDAHTGALQNDLNIQSLDRKYQNSPLTHHMTPQTILAILDQTFDHKPEAILVSVRGFQFGFENFLSPNTKKLATEAIEKISQWIIH
jgi:hydrogenase maturation protease